MKDRRESLFFSGLLGFIALVALVVGLSEAQSAEPFASVNGAAGSLLIALILLSVVAQFWRPARSIPVSRDGRALLVLSEPWFLYLAPILLGLGLIGFAALGFVGWSGSWAELAAAAGIATPGFLVILFKLYQGRGRIVLSPRGLSAGGRPPLAWSDIVGVRATKLPWSSAVVVDAKPSAASGRKKIKLRASRLGVEPDHLAAAIEQRRAIFTF